MTQTHIGWGLIAVAAGMMLTSLSAEIKALSDWGQLMTPAFVGSALGHLGGVILAAIGGKYLPTPEK